MIYLKFDNELQMMMELNEYLTRDTVVNEEGELEEVGEKYFIGNKKSTTHGHKAGQWEIWVRGTLSRPTGETEVDSEGNEVSVMEALTGFHVDLDPKFGSHTIEEWTEKGYIQEPLDPMFRK